MRTAGLITQLVLCCGAFGQASITVLQPAAFASQSSASVVSGNGEITSGYCIFPNGSSFTSRAERWVPGAGAGDMGTFHWSTPWMYQPSGANVDGSVIVGTAGWRNGPGSSGARYKGFRWSSYEYEALPSLDGQINTDVYAYGVSADGTVVVGSSGTTNTVGSPTRAVLWTASGAIQNLGVFPGAAYSTALGVNADASVIVGWSGLDQNSERAFRATNNTGEWVLSSLGTLPGATSSEAFAVSGDGSAIVGRSYFGDFTLLNSHAFRWTSRIGMEDLGTLPDWTLATGLAVSYDGSAVIGYLAHSLAHPQDITFSAFLWTRDLGMVDLNSLLPALGADLTGWILNIPTAISNDGSVIVGWGRLNGEVRGWIVHLPPLCGSADYNHDGSPGSDLDINAFFACLGGDCCPRCTTTDFNGDHDYGTDADIEAFFRVLAGGPC